MKTPKSYRFAAAGLPAIVCALLLASTTVRAQDALDVDPLTIEQEQVSDKYVRLEALMLRMAEFDATTNPRRAQILRKAYALSKQDHVGLQLETIVKLLEQDKLSRAINNQKSVGEDLSEILKLLLTENRSDRIKSEQARLQEYIKDLERIIRGERWLRSRTESSDDTNRLADQQKEMQKRTDSLGQKMDAHEGSRSDTSQGDPSSSESDKSSSKSDSKSPSPSDTPSKDGQSDAEKSKDGQSDAEKSDAEKSDAEGTPSDSENGEGATTPSGKPNDSSSPESPGQQQPGGSPSGSPQQQQQQQQNPRKSSPGRQRVEQAKKKMEDAEQQLRDANRQQAKEDQQAALRELEQAKAELEEILRQLREEEIERTLALLEARFRRMLDEQTIIYEKTQALGKIAKESRNRQMEIDAGKLGFQERRLIRDAESALALLREEGSSVAFPEAVEQLRDDMRQVAQRLANGKVDGITQGIEEDIIAALEEMIEALQMAAKEQEERRDQQQSQPSSSDQDQALVNQIAEMKMLRALQFRINRRTTRYAQLLEDMDDLAGQATDGELVDALRNLAGRERKLQKITREIVLGKNK